MFVPGTYSEMVITHRQTGYPDAFSIINWVYEPWLWAFNDHADRCRNVIVDAVAAHLTGNLSDHWGMTQITITDKNVADGASKTYGMAIAGTQPGDSMQAGTAILIRWHGLGSGRAHHGRTFWPGLRESHNEGLGVPTLGIRTVFSAFANQVITDAFSEGQAVAVASKRVGGVVRPAAEVNGVVSTTIGTRWARQKRRERF